MTTSSERNNMMVVSRPRRTAEHGSLGTCAECDVSCCCTSNTATSEPLHELLNDVENVHTSPALIKRRKWTFHGVALAFLICASITTVATPTLTHVRMASDTRSRGNITSDDESMNASTNSASGSMEGLLPLHELREQKLEERQRQTPIASFHMEPLTESHRRRLQRLACSNPLNDNGDRTCSFQGEMKFVDAMNLYRTFCPRWPASRVCARSGLPQIELTCNGYTSTLFGGIRIPPGSPVLDKDPLNKTHALFPSADRGYFALQDVAQADGTSCSHVFEGGMFCYVEQPQICFVWAGWQPSSCEGAVNMCG